MEDAEQATRDRIATWFSLNRQGKNAGEPCYWSLYPVSSPTAKVIGTSNRTCNNYEVEQLEASVDMLMRSMSTNTHTKYYAVRLRKDSKDTEFMSYFANPYYVTNRASLSGLPSEKSTANFSSNNNILMRMFLEQSNHSQKDYFELQAQMMTLQQQYMNSISEKKQELQEYKKEVEINGLKDRIKQIESAKESRISLLLDKFTPLLEMVIEKKMEGFIEIPTEKEEEEHFQQDNNNSILDVSLNEFKQVVKNPKDVELLKKLYIAIVSVTDEERKKFDEEMKKLVKIAEKKNKAQ